MHQMNQISPVMMTVGDPDYDLFCGFREDESENKINRQLARMSLEEEIDAAVLWSLTSN